MDLICSNCGNQVRENAKFCDTCGNVVNPEISSNNNFQISNQLKNNLPDQQPQNDNQLDNEVKQTPNNSSQNRIEQAYESDDYSQNNEKLNNFNYSEAHYNNRPHYSKEKLTFSIAIKNWWSGSFSGRCSRREWWFTFWCITPFCLLLFFGPRIFGINIYFLSFPFDSIISLINKLIPFWEIFPKSNEYIKGFLLYAINVLLLLITIKPQIALLTRRFHDLSMSGFWQIFFWISTILDYCIILFFNLSPYLSQESETYCFNLLLKLLSSYHIINYIILFFGLIFVFAPGKIVNNKYGPPSKY